MKRSDCKAGLQVYAQHPKDKLFYAAQIRAMGNEDVYLDWGEQARTTHTWLPASVGYPDLRPSIFEMVQNYQVQDYRPKAFPVDLDEKPKDDGTTEPVQDQTSWHSLWRRFERIMNQKRGLDHELSKLKRDAMQFLAYHYNLPRGIHIPPEEESSREVDDAPATGPT